MNWLGDAMRFALLLLLTTIPPSRYRAADGTLVRRPHLYKRHPNAATAWTGTCRDGSVTFAHTHQGACSHHGGIRAWH